MVRVHHHQNEFSRILNCCSVLWKWDDRQYFSALEFLLDNSSSLCCDFFLIQRCTAVVYYLFQCWLESELESV